MCFDDFECRLFPYTLEGKASVGYHNLPPNSIHNSREFKHTFLEKFSNDKTPAIFLARLGNIKMREKEKIKYFNQRFTCIMNKFPMDVHPHDLITKDYYTTALPTHM